MLGPGVDVLGSLSRELDSAQSLAANGSALYTLLGAGIAAVAGLASVGLKYRFDSKAETTRRAHELEKLTIELDAQREAADRDRRITCVANVLAVTSSLYEQVRTARRLRREGTIDDSEYLSRLKLASVEGGQVALEELRLACSASTAESADALWAHLRGDAVPRGATLRSSDWVAWKEKYWSLRHDLISVSRTSEEGDDSQRRQRRHPVDDEQGESR